MSLLMIDVTFSVYSDTPPGKDPDRYSATLRRYHKQLWSKQLPGGAYFALNDHLPGLLTHRSELGDFTLSSDSIGHTYRRVKHLSHIVEQVSREETDQFFDLCSTIGGYILFPSKRVENKMTINGARGTNRKIGDRFDLTLECIRRMYLGRESPLQDTLGRYAEFFSLFRDFEGYFSFFLLQDLVEGQSVNFHLPFDNFQRSPFPQDLGEYMYYKENVSRFISSRNRRIASV